MICIFLFAKPKTKVKILEGFLAWKTLTNYFRKPIHWALKKKKREKNHWVPLPLTSPLADVFGIDPKVFSHAPVS